MAISARYARQSNKVALVSFLFSDLPTGVFVPLVELPKGSLLTAGEVVVRTVSNTGTTDVLDVGTSAAPNTYLNDANFKAAARTALSSLGTTTTAAAITIGITRAAVGTAATTGEGLLRIEYSCEGVNECNYGELS